jgi:hypothetical protein
MTSHELAYQLLQWPDVPMYISMHEGDASAHELFQEDIEAGIKSELVRAVGDQLEQIILLK